MAHQTDRHTTLHRKPNDVPMDATHRGSIHHVVLVPCVTAWRRNHVKSQWCTCAIHDDSAVASTDDNLHIPPPWADAQIPKFRLRILDMAMTTRSSFG